VRTLRLAALAAALAITVPAAAGTSPPASWPQSRFDAAHSGFNPRERVLSPTSVARLRVAWRRLVGGPVPTGPSVVGERLYVSSDNRRVHAFDTASGRRIWSARLPGRPSSPAVSGGRVFVVVEDGFVYALAAGTGRRLWRVSISSAEGGGWPAAPTVADGVVYTMGISDGVTALEARTGRRLWQHAVECFGCPVAVSGRQVYIGGDVTTDGVRQPARMYALDRTTGATVWSTEIAGLPFWTPAVSGNRVFLASATEANRVKTFRLEAFDIADGRTQWSVPIGESRVYTFAAPAVAGSRIVVPSPSGDLVAHDVTTGRQLWRAPLPVGSSAPAIANGVVYVGAGNGIVYAFRLRNGQRLWSAKLGRSLDSPPTVVNGAVYVGSEDGAVVAFRRR
jgi:eukaryotic-like serine/threonine-protein kinase